MVSVFLSHSSQDKPFVRDLATFLERDPKDEIKVWLDEREIAPGQNIVSKIQQGLKADFTILILSPHSVKSKWIEEEWTSAFWQQTNAQQTKLLPVLYGDCETPALLENKKYFDLRTNRLDGFYEIKTFLLTQHPVTPKRMNQLPSRPPLFIGRERELAELRRRLSEKGTAVHIAAMPGQGKTTLALEFAHRYESDFEAVYWLPCQSGSLSAIAGELERQLDLKLQKDLAETVRDLKDFCAKKRCLLILDNVDNEAPGELIPGGAAAVLVTTRHHNLRFLRSRRPLDLPLFTKEECFQVFRRELGEEALKGNDAQCEQLFRRLGYLPFGVTVAASLIREDVRYTITSLAADLPADVKELIQEAIQALEEPPRQLLRAMAACAPEGFALSLACEIAGLDEARALNALQQLVSRSLTEELSRTDRRYRLHALVRETADGTSLAQKHAEAVRKQFKNWEANWRQCEQDLSDFQLAFAWGLSNADGYSKDFPLDWLAYYGYALTERIGRPAEALEICERIGRFFEKRDDDSNLQVWLGNQALILQAWGKLDEALELLKKQEEICLALGDQDWLQHSYGNQAGIFLIRGRLDESMDLYKKQEEICLVLGSQDGLQRSYAGQALILKALGRVDEAFALHKKEEEICLALGNQDSLQRSYGNQALILKAWGRLDEAFALHKKQEDICLALGNKSDLGSCYAAWGLLERALNHPQAERDRLAAALAIFEELKMPRERDEVKAELEESLTAGAS